MSNKYIEIMVEKIRKAGFKVDYSDNKIDIQEPFTSNIDGRKIFSPYSIIDSAKKLSDYEVEDFLNKIIQNHLT